MDFVGGAILALFVALACWLLLPRPTGQKAQPEETASERRSE